MENEEDFFKEQEAQDSILDDAIELSGDKTISVLPADSALGYLYSLHLTGRLNVQPPYQRKYVWDNGKASKLIESILMNIPIPMIYLAQTLDGDLNVIDGQQRLTSVFKFMSGDFKLSSMKVFPNLKGKSFKELEKKYQNIINDYTVRTNTFTADSDPELQYEIFSRLNTGSVQLNTQELRNCVYRGKFNEFIKELALDKDFLDIFGLSAPSKRMKDVEFVLRFIAFYSNGYQNYKSPIKTFLNETMRRYSNANETDYKNLRLAFKNAVTNIKSLLGTNCFKRFKVGSQMDKNGEWEQNRFNAALFDILMDSMARLDPTVVYRHLDSIREAYINLMCESEEFNASITINTSDKPEVKRRFEIWNNTLNTVIGDDQVEKRCFSRELKEKLYKENPTCEICKQYITSVDDAAVDHVEQYWMGGKTIESNARLTHRYCNWSRSRKE